jgi:hypothetical protein
MDSSTLLQLGFCDWKLFQEGVQRLAPPRKGVYSFRSSNYVSLKKGRSDIMYIGRANGVYHHIQQSIRQYLHSGWDNATKIRVGDKASQNRWEVSWKQDESAKDAERLLLERFYNEHGQLPPENKQRP